MKFVWMLITLIVLAAPVMIGPEDSFPFVVALLIGVLLSGLVLNFTPAAKGTIWKNIGWGMFYGALSFVVLCLALFAYVWFFMPLPLPNTG